MKKIFALAVVLFVIGTTQANARPSGCPHAWCGCYLAQAYGYTGAMARKLWLARNWLMFPRASMAPGNVAVFSRGRGGHVGRIEAVKDGQVLLHSGNDGRAVRTRWRSTRGLIAVVSPGGSVHQVAEVSATRKIRHAKRYKSRIREARRPVRTAPPHYGLHSPA